MIDNRYEWHQRTLSGLRGIQDIEINVLYCTELDAIHYKGKNYLRSDGGNWTTFETKGRPYTLITHSFFKK